MKISQYWRQAAQKPGLTIAYLRVVIALVLLGLSISDPEDIGLARELDDAIFAAYLVIATANLMVAIASWTREFTLWNAMFLIDFGVFLVLPYAEMPYHTDVALTAPVMGFGIVMSAFVRHNRAVAIQVALVLNLLCLANCGLMLGMMHDHMISIYVRQILMLAASTACAVWAMTFFTPKMKGWEGIQLGMINQNFADSLLRSLMDKWAAGRGYVIIAGQSAEDETQSSVLDH